MKPDRSAAGRPRPALVASLPLVRTLQGHSARDLRGDLIAGLTVAIMLVPQSMAYAGLAGLPPEAGLYASVVPLVVYALLGTSRTLAVGPVAIVSLLTASALAPLAEGDPARYAALAALLAGIVGVIQLGLGVLRAGRLVAFLSHPVIVGFTSAAAIVIAASQLSTLLGIDAPRADGFIARLEALVSHGAPHPATAIIGVGALGLILVLRRRARRVPGALAAVVVATIAVWVFGLDGAGVRVLGEVPRGLAAPSFPALDGTTVGVLLPAALGIAVIGFAEGIGIARATTDRGRDLLDANQELIAVGSANLAAGFFSAFPIAGGLSRTAVNHEAGARSQLASLVAAAGIALTVTLLTPLLSLLPAAALAAIVIGAVLRLLDIREMRAIIRLRTADGAVLAATFLATLLMSVEAGLLIGVIASLIVFIDRSSRPHLAELGRVAGTDLYRNRLRYDVEIDERIPIVRVDGPLFHGSARQVTRELERRIADQPEISGLVIDASAITDVDSDGIHELETLMVTCRDRGIGLALATVRGPVRDLIERSEAAGWLLAIMAPDIETAIALADGNPTTPSIL